MMSNPPTLFFNLIILLLVALFVTSPTTIVSARVLSPKQSEEGSASRAYVTFLAAGNGDYIKGVVGLSKGLRKVKSSYPLVVVILPNVPQEHRRILESQGCILREVEPVYPPLNRTHRFSMDSYAISYAKLHFWQLVEYSKMISLDSDVQVYENIDHLFDLPDGYMYGVMDCFCEFTWNRTIQYKIGYCQQSPDRVAWPADLGRPSVYYNTGLFVFEPSLSDYVGLMEALKVTPPFLFGEQDLFNTYFKDIYKALSLEYNFLTIMLWRHPENFVLEQVKVVHYVGGTKPWKYNEALENMNREDVNLNREDVKMLVAKWWDIYNDDTLDYKWSVIDQNQELNELLGNRNFFCVTHDSLMHPHAATKKPTAHAKHQQTQR